MHHQLSNLGIIPNGIVQEDAQAFKTYIVEESNFSNKVLLDKKMPSYYL